jgi:Eukaryotic protein of unknown function (DUF829)
MPAQLVPSPLTGFQRLNASTYIYEPPTSPSPASSSAPDLILLPSWLDAAPRHIAKYTRGYQTLYPSARILLITTAVADVTIRTRAAEAARLAPALSLLISLPSNPGILLHSFSNGGAYTSHLLARLYLARTGRVLSICAQILDSAPGHGHYGRTATALALGLPRSPAVLYYVSLVMLHLFLAAYSVAKTATGGQNKIHVMREGLLDQRVWDGAVPRCYVFSKEDKMVVWEDVAEHAGMSRERGWKRVSVEEFEGSAHCGHLLVDEGRYWGVVERVWGER